MFPRVKILSRPILREFWERADCSDAEQPLLSWFKEVESAQWATPADVKKLYRSADFVAGDRIVFNIGGNKYRLVVWVKYSIGLVLIKWVGTHEEYDQIDVTTIGLPARPKKAVKKVPKKKAWQESAMKKAKLKVIRNEQDYREALETIERLWDAEPGTSDHDTLEVLALLVEHYEKKAFPMEEPDPIAAIRFRLEQTGKEQKDLVPILGSRSRVSEIMSRKRSLTVGMIRRLFDELHIPMEALIPRQDDATADAR